MYDKNVVRSKKIWYKITFIYILVAACLIVAWYFSRSVIPMLFGISFFIAGIACLSHATMTEAQLQTFLHHKKKQSIMIARIFILGSTVAYFLIFLVPFDPHSLLIPRIGAYVSLPLVIAGALDHFYTRARLFHNNSKRII